MSPFTGRPYPTGWIRGIFRVPRSTVYAHRTRRGSDAPGAKRGPKTGVSDEQLLLEIRSVIQESPFRGEGHRKVTARLRAKGFRVGKNRVLRLMRENQLLAPVRQGFPNGDPAHGGAIITQRPDELWGTDATRFFARTNGWCWFFGAVDHCTNEVVGWHVAKKGDRWAALEPIRQGVTRRFGRYETKVAQGLGLRHDWGPQYTANRFLGELKWLGIRSSLAYVVRRRAGVQRCDGALASDAEGGVPLPT